MFDSLFPYSKKKIEKPKAKVLHASEKLTKYQGDVLAKSPLIECRLIY